MAATVRAAICGFSQQGMTADLSLAEARPITIRAMQPSDHDPLIKLTEARNYLLEIHGRTACYATLRRWAARGCAASKGQRLETLRVGGQCFTRRKWIDQFIQACNPEAAVSPPLASIDPNFVREEQEIREYLLSRGYGGKGRGGRKSSRETPL